MTFKAGQQVVGKSGRVLTIVKVVKPTRAWSSKNYPVDWVWLYFEGQRSGFCSNHYKVTK